MLACPLNLLPGLSSVVFHQHLHSFRICMCFPTADWVRIVKGLDTRDLGCAYMSALLDAHS